MKTILCFGDSNTWGYSPENGTRFDLHTRWAGVLRDILGGDYWVIEEGLSGRTTVWDEPIEALDPASKNGSKYLPACLESHQPLDLVIICLGVNDTKVRFSVSAFDIANSAGKLVGMVQQSNAGPGGKAPAVLLIAPPPVGKLTAFSQMFAGAVEKSRQFAKEFGRAAAERGCHFLDAGKVVVSSDLDGIHFEAGEHRKLGVAVAEVVRRVLG